MNIAAIELGNAWINPPLSEFKRALISKTRTISIFNKQVTDRAISLNLFFTLHYLRESRPEIKLVADTVIAGYIPGFSDYITPNKPFLKPGILNFCPSKEGKVYTVYAGYKGPGGVPVFQDMKSFG